MTTGIALQENPFAEWIGRPYRPSDPAWLAERRLLAGARFIELGLPGPSHEDWRYTSVRPIADAGLSMARSVLSSAVAELEPLDVGDVGAVTVLFVNGQYVPRLSGAHTGIPGVQCGSLAQVLSSGERLNPRLTLAGSLAMWDSNAFAALNLAMFGDAAVLLVRANVQVRRPIHFRFITTGSAVAAHPRLFVAAEEGSSVCIVESYSGFRSNGALTNSVAEVMVGRNATVEHYRLQQEPDDCFHIAATGVAMEADSRYTHHNFALGAAIARTELTAWLGEPGIECTLNGLYMVGGTQVVDNRTELHHAAPHCNSHELYKGVMMGSSRGSFNGKIHVHPDAQKTDAKQTSQGLLLSPDAQLNTKPQLEIYADDVRCTHGATVGRLSEEALFYLRSRGIGEAEALELLTSAFAGDIVNRVGPAHLKEYLGDLVSATQQAGKSGARSMIGALL